MSRIDLPFASMLYSPFRSVTVPFGRTFYHDVRPDDRFARSSVMIPVTFGLASLERGRCRVSTDGYRYSLA